MVLSAEQREVVLSLLPRLAYTVVDSTYHQGRKIKGCVLKRALLKKAYTEEEEKIIKSIAIVDFVRSGVLYGRIKSNNSVEFVVAYKNATEEVDVEVKIDKTRFKKKTQVSNFCAYSAGSSSRLCLLCKRPRMRSKTASVIVSPFCAFHHRQKKEEEPPKVGKRPPRRLRSETKRKPLLWKEMEKVRLFLNKKKQNE